MAVFVGAGRSVQRLGVCAFALLTGCGPDLSGLFATDYSSVPEPTPTPVSSVFRGTFVANGELTRTSAGCRLRMPTVEIEETAGYGGYLTGSTATIMYVDTAGRSRNSEESLNRGSVSDQLGNARYEGKAKRTVELSFDVEGMSPRPRDGLLNVVWSLHFTDDTHALGTVVFRIPLDRLDLGPGL